MAMGLDLEPLPSKNFVEAQRPQKTAMLHSRQPSAWKEAGPR